MWTICGHREVFEGLLTPGHGALYSGRVSDPRRHCCIGDHRKQAGWVDASSPCPSVRAEIGLRHVSVPAEVITLAVRWYLRFGTVLP